MSKLNGHRKGYKKTKLGWIPKDWEENLLGNLIEICSSKRVLQKDWKKEGVPFLRTLTKIRSSMENSLAYRYCFAGIRLQY